MQSDLAIRDNGPYSTRNTAKGALLTEAGQVFAALARGITVDQVRDAVLSGSILAQRSINSRRGIWKRLHHRYLTHRIDWVISLLIDALEQGAHTPEFVSLLYLHYALRDRLATNPIAPTSPGAVNSSICFGSCRWSRGTTT